MKRLTIDEVIERALRPSAPCTATGPKVRDHLHPRLSPIARAAIRARLDKGEQSYGAALRLGHDDAEKDLTDELLDAAAYAAAGGMVGPDVDALIILTNRAVEGAFGRHL